MTSTAIGLPDRYRPIDQSGPDEPTATGVIRSWRAKDRVLNRDVSIRVHSPGGPAAHAWITRALTAGGLATPALAMVYDAAEGSAGPDGSVGPAYVVNEWIDGETLADRLHRGPLSDRETRTVLRRLAEGVAEAHRVGLAVGSLSAENVVLRPNGLVGLRGVPAATGTVDGDIAQLGALLEACLTGLGPPAPGARRPAVAPDLAALVRRARSTGPGQGLSSAAAMATLLAEWPRSGSAAGPARGDGDGEGEGGRLRRLRGRQSATAEPVRPVADPPVPPIEHPVRPVDRAEEARTDEARAQGVRAGRALAHEAGAYEAGGHEAGPDGPHGAAGRPVTGATAVSVPTREDRPGAPRGVGWSGAEEPSGLAAAGPRRRALVIALPLLALAVVIGLGVWLGSSVLSVAGSVGEVRGSGPSTQAAPSGSGAATSGSGTATSRTSEPVKISSAKVFDPYGDGSPENDKEVRQSYDGNPVTNWSTLQYRGSARFGGLKPGVGILYDLGSPQSLSGVALASITPGGAVEVRTGSTGDGKLTDYAVEGTTRLSSSSTVTFAKPVTARYVLIWVTGLVQGSNGYSADLAEVSPLRAG